MLGCAKKPPLYPSKQTLLGGIEVRYVPQPDITAVYADSQPAKGVREGLRGSRAQLPLAIEECR